MSIHGTQMHLITAIIIFLETILLAIQTARFMLRLEDKHRGRYSLLLALLIVYDFTRGIFPDSGWALSIPLQHMISYGAGFLTAAYFPFYFYKEFDLRSLRWHATVGVFSFLMIPYLLFFVLLYAVNGNFVADVRMGIVIPFIYAIILLRAILIAIRKHYKSNRDHHFYIEEISVYCAVSPWVAMGVFVWFQMEQVTEILFTNLGFVIITIMFFVKSARRATAEYRKKQSERIAVFEANCMLYKLTTREKEVAWLLVEGYSYKEIAAKLFLSDNTVGNYVQKIYEKIGVRKRQVLINKLLDN